MYSETSLTLSWIFVELVGALVGCIHRTAVNETKRELLIEGEGPSFVRRPTSPTSCHRKTTHNRAFRTFDVWAYGRMVMAKQRMI